MKTLETPQPRETAPRDGTVFYALVWDEDKVPVRWIEYPEHPDGGYFGLGQFEQDYWDKWHPIAHQSDGSST